MRLLCALLLLLSSSAAMAAEPEVKDNDLERLLEEMAFCYAAGDAMIYPGGHIACRLPSARSCARKTDAQERIKCLEEVIDQMGREIPRMIEEALERRLSPKLYKNEKSGG